MTLGNGKGQDNKFKSFLKQTSLAFIKTFCGKWKEEHFLSDSSFLRNLKNAKTNTILTI